MDVDVSEGEEGGGRARISARFLFKASRVSSIGHAGSERGGTVTSLHLTGLERSIELPGGNDVCVYTSFVP